MQTDYHEKIIRRRKERDQFFRSHYASPLSDEEMGRFGGLRYFDIDPELVLATSLEPAEETTIEISSSSGGTSHYPVAGTVAIQLGDVSLSLVALSGEEGEVFIPFRDGTSGAGSYGGGRYVAVEQLGDGTAVVDFNVALNPYCVYDADFSCPLPPRQNWIDFPIEAGERDYRP